MNGAILGAIDAANPAAAAIAPNVIYTHDVGAPRAPLEYRQP